MMPYRTPAMRNVHPRDDAELEYARTCLRDRRLGVVAALAFFAVVVIAVFVVPAMAPPHYPAMKDAR